MIYIANMNTNDLCTDVKIFTFTGRIDASTDAELTRGDIHDYDDNNEDVLINILDYIQATINSCEDNAIIQLVKIIWCNKLNNKCNEKRGIG